MEFEGLKRGRTAVLIGVSLAGLLGLGAWGLGLGACALGLAPWGLRLGACALGLAPWAKISWWMSGSKELGTGGGAPGRGGVSW
jgi:hypothetical protein